MPKVINYTLIDKAARRPVNENMKRGLLGMSSYRKAAPKPTTIVFLSFEMSIMAIER